MKVAIDKVVLTPPSGAKGVPMAGYTRPHYAQGKLDDVFARAVLIEDKVLGNVSKKLLLISIDTLKVPMIIADYIKEKIQEKTNFGLGPGRILVHGTHTHSAPDLTGEYFWPGGTFNVIKGILFGANRSDRYVVWMTMQIVKLVKRLLTKLTPCKLAWAKQKVEQNIAINRRHPKRRSKQTMSTIAFKDLKTNKIIGLVVSYGVHPTTMNHSNDKMSAEFPGRVCARIEEQSNDEIKPVFFTGAAGDLNPITTCGTDFDRLEDDPAARNTVYQQFGTYEHTTKIGFTLGDIALKLAKSIPEEKYFDTFEYESVVKRFWIPFEDYQPYIYSKMNWLSNKLIMFAKKFILFPIAMMHPENQEPNFPGLAIKAYPFSLKKGYHINVYTVIQYIKISVSSSKDPKTKKELAILGTPGELFEDIEKKLLNRSPQGPEDTIIFQNANDWCGYLYPIKEYITQGGYEPFASTAPLVGPGVRKEFEILFKEIEAGIQFGKW
jgi:Neutral/alkaline non-lysosomal ceramidase, N-terminal